MDFKGQFVLDENGYLDPIVYGCDINFGESDVVSSDWFVEFWTFELIHFSFIVIQNTAWIIGPFMFTNMLGPVMDKYLNHYQQDMYLWSPVKGMEDVKDTFTLDYRNNFDPIHDTYSVTFKFVGEFFYKN